MSSLNRSAARSRASCAALRVKARKAIFWGLIPSVNALSTMSKRVVVLPVPGGPKILNTSYSAHQNGAFWRGAKGMATGPICSEKEGITHTLVAFPLIFKLVAMPFISRNRCAIL